MDESRFLSVVSYICLSRLGSNAPPLIPLGALVCSRHSLRTPGTFHATISRPPCGRDGGEEVGRPEPWPEISPFVRPRVPLSNQLPQWRGSPSRLSAYENEEQRASRRGDSHGGGGGHENPLKGPLRSKHSTEACLREQRAIHKAAQCESTTLTRAS